MELRRLRYFVAVAEELSFTKAAARLHIAQPPLSEQIKRLERELEVQLFERTRHYVRLTAAGEVLLTEARNLLLQADRSTVVVQAAHRGEHGHLAIGCVPSGFANVLQPIVRRFGQRFPAVSLSLRELIGDAQLREIDAQRLDLGFVRALPKDSAYHSAQVLQEPFVAVLPDDDVLAVQERVHLADLADRSFVFFGRRAGGARYFDTLLRACREAGFVPNIIQECDSVTTELGMVACGLGVALVPESISQLGVPGVVYRPLDRSGVQLGLFAVWPRDRHSTTRDRFLELLEHETRKRADPAATRATTQAPTPTSTG